MISKLLAQLIKRKFTTGIALVLIVGVGYFGYGKIFSNDGAIRYATAQVQNGTLIVSISGSGQVSASNQVDVKPKAKRIFTDEDRLKRSERMKMTMKAYWDKKKNIL